MGEILLQQISSPFPYLSPLFEICATSGLLFDGIIHWEVWGPIIMCIDLRIRKLSKMTMPDGFPYLTVLRECLAA